MSKLDTLIKQLTEYNEWQQFKKMADRIREDYGVELTHVYAGRHGATLTTQPASDIRVWHVRISVHSLANLGTSTI